MSAYKQQFSPGDFSSAYSPLSARMPAYPSTPLGPGYPHPSPLTSDCPLDLNAPFEMSQKYLKDMDNFFSTRLFRQNGDITSNVLPMPKPSPRVDFFKGDKLPPISKPLLNMRDFESTPLKEDSPNYTTSPSSPGSESDSSMSSSSTGPNFTSPPPSARKIAFRPYRVQKPKHAGSASSSTCTTPTSATAPRKQLAVELVAGHVGLVKKEHSASPSPTDSPFGRGMAPSTSGMSNVERLKANPDMWTQATQVKKGVYVCTHCPSNGGRFRKLSELAAHFDENNLTRLCKCDFPDCAWSIVGFSSRSEKTRHIKSQHASTRYSCMHCERVFARSDSLKRHFKLIHNMPNVTPEEVLTMRSTTSAVPDAMAYDDVKEEEQEPGMPPPSSTSVFVATPG
ncbi:Krueppel-like factor 15 [Yarrowia sp. C11]|nr:Krueppel-like factor 15 [Yarrowia sp. C11]KAG5364677.1 Krueppel-like factor 15 [Yarrowia sp. E02]